MIKKIRYSKAEEPEVVADKINELVDHINSEEKEGESSEKPGKIICKVCSNCRGSGKLEDWVVGSVDCKNCNGTGRIETSEWQEGDKVYYVDTYGQVLATFYEPEQLSHCSLLSNGNLFRTEDEAEAHKMRIESLSKGTAVKGEEWWCWSFVNNKPESYCISWVEFTMDVKFKTEKECQDWYNEYGEYWENN